MLTYKITIAVIGLLAVTTARCWQDCSTASVCKASSGPSSSGDGSSSGPGNGNQGSGDWQVVWADDFDGSAGVDNSKWKVQTGCFGLANDEKQCYVDNRENLFVQNGILNIKAINAPPPSPSSGTCKVSPTVSACAHDTGATSARIHTHINSTHNTWKYGRFEAKMKLPSGSFLWPGFFMLPGSNTYGSWPSSGEIDIMEARSQVRNTIVQSLHYGKAFPYNKQTTFETDIGVDANRDFHVYGVDWSLNEIVWRVDGKETKRQSLDTTLAPSYNHARAPFDQPFYVVLSLAVGGNFFPKNRFGTWSRTEGANWTDTFQIDWVKVSIPSNQSISGDPLETSSNVPRGSLTLYPIGDTYISSEAAEKDVAFGSDVLLQVLHTNTIEKLALFKFFIDTDTSQLKNATLQLSLLNERAPGKEYKFDIYMVGVEWREDSLTYASGPSLGNKIASYSTTGGSAKLEIGQALRGKQGQIGLAVKSEEQEGALLIHSKESWAAPPARLVLGF
jgi:beta-glucanase (GH16 family)